MPWTGSSRSSTGSCIGWPSAISGGERPGHTLQPSAIVNEAYLRLLGRQGADWQNRAHFFAVAAQSMRRILVEHARRRDAKKRGGEGTRYLLDTVVMTEPRAVDLIARGRRARQADRAGRGAGPGRRAALLRWPDRGRDRGGALDLLDHRSPQVAPGQGVPAPRALRLLRMTPERWRRAQEVFAAATEREPGSRAAFLEEACRDDPELRTEVESLLSSFGAAPSGFLESPAIEGVPALPRRSEPGPVPREGDAPGSLRDPVSLGAGGMGEVYRAQRPAAGARGGDQGAVGGAVLGRLAGEAVREGGAVGLGPEPSEHRHGLRLRVLRRALVHRDGEGRRRDAEEARLERAPSRSRSCFRSRPRSPTAWPGRTRPGSCTGT